MSAAGGKAHNGSCYSSWRGANGGSGGGEGCNGPCRAGAGGSEGLDGSKASTGRTWGIGIGNGSYTALLKNFSLNNLTPGQGGNNPITNSEGV